MKPKIQLFFTTQPDKSAVRRRDPFGFAQIAAYYADLLAPGLTNRNRDPRWLSIICWSLQQVRHDFGDLEQDEFYERLRGLELRWILASLTGDQLKNSRRRHLPAGSDGLRGWVKARNRKSLPYCMGSQWQRYRYVGPFAAYRGLAQSCGLIDESGWNLTARGRDLARKISLEPQTAKKLTRHGWLDYWLRRVPDIPDKLLPVGSMHPRLPMGERSLLADPLFKVGPDSQVRAIVANALAETRAGRHAKACQELQRKLLTKRDFISRASDLEKLRVFGAFAELADAAVLVLRNAFNFVRKKEAASIKDVSAELKMDLDSLAIAAGKWSTIGVWPDIDQFVVAILGARSLSSRLRVVVDTHGARGSGVLWLRIVGENLDRELRFDSPPDGYYRFRLEALSKLWAGCGGSVPAPGRPRCFASEQDDRDEV